MTKQQKQLYGSADAFRQLLWEALAGRKFQLDCGHHVSLGQQLGSDIVIRNGAKNKGFVVTCSLCSY